MIRVNEQTGKDASPSEIRKVYPQLPINDTTTDLSHLGFPFLVEKSSPTPKFGKRVVRGPNKKEKARYSDGRWRPDYPETPQDEAWEWHQTWKLEDIPLDELKETYSEVIDVTMKEKMKEFPITINDKLVHLQLRGVTDQSNWHTLMLRAFYLVNSGSLSKKVNIRTKDNEILSIEASLAVEVMNELTSFGTATLEHAWKLKDKLNNCKKASEIKKLVDSIDSGWPIDSIKKEGQ